VAELINESFLRQSAFSEADRFCSVGKQIAMIQLISRFIDLSAAAVAQGIRVEDINALPVMRRLRRMGEDINEDGQQEKMDELRRDLDAAFTRMTREAAGDAR
jgi:V/A-type H+-transporting ATPase subunit A